MSGEFSLRQEIHILDRMNHAKEKEIESLKKQLMVGKSIWKEADDRIGVLQDRLEVMWAWMEEPLGDFADSFIEDNPDAADWFDDEGRVK